MEAADELFHLFDSRSGGSIDKVHAEAVISQLKTSFLQLNTSAERYFTHPLQSTVLPLSR